MNEDEYDLITKTHFKRDIITRNENDDELKCTKCDSVNDYREDHAYLCKSGVYNHVWKHNQINKFICE